MSCGEAVHTLCEQMACNKVICTVGSWRIRYGNRNTLCREILRAYILPCAICINLQSNIINPDIVIGNAFGCEAAPNLTFNFLRRIQRIVACKLGRNFNRAAHLQTVIVLVGGACLNCPDCCRRCLSACVISSLIAWGAAGTAASGLAAGLTRRGWFARPIWLVGLVIVRIVRTGLIGGIIYNRVLGGIVRSGWQL